MTIPVRPRDAASLVLHRMRDGVPEVLVGLRHRRHKFMPETWVFPGGRVDPGDYGVAVATDLREEVAARLMRHTTRARAKALAVAAVRETYEEAGLMLGAPASPPKGPVGEHWRGFLDRGLAPALDALDVL
ncbi:MAG: NUDIX domain-containing protein, partial [Alphaproteobacteria bacterium]